MRAQSSSPGLTQFSYNTFLLISIVNYTGPYSAQRYVCVDYLTQVNHITTYLFIGGPTYFTDVATLYLPSLKSIDRHWPNVKSNSYHLIWKDKTQYDSKFMRTPIFLKFPN